MVISPAGQFVAYGEPGSAVPTRADGRTRQPERLAMLACLNTLATVARGRHGPPVPPAKGPDHSGLPCLLWDSAQDAVQANEQPARESLKLVQVPLLRQPREPGAKKVEGQQTAFLARHDLQNRRSRAGIR